MADSNQPSAGVAIENAILEKQQVPIEAQQPAAGVAKEAELPEKQQVPIAVQKVMTGRVDLNVADGNEPAASDA